jgi:hypothetical protein
MVCRSSHDGVSGQSAPVIPSGKCLQWRVNDVSGRARVVDGKRGVAHARDLQSSLIELFVEGMEDGRAVPSGGCLSHLNIVCLA